MKTYQPYIEGYTEHVQRIYEWNERVDELRLEKYKPNSSQPGFISIEDMYKNTIYMKNDGLRLYYEEKGEYTTAKLNNDIEEQMDALIDQFVVCVGEIRKCALANEFTHIKFWEDCIDTITYQLEMEFGMLPYEWNVVDRAFAEVLDALFTRFGPDAYIDENNKFIKSKSFRRPDLSFIKK